MRIFDVFRRLFRNGRVPEPLPPPVAPPPLPPPSPPPALPPPVGWHADLLQRHNVVRARYNVPALTANDRLDAAASDHAIWMARHATLTHNGNGEPTFGSRVLDEGYRFADAGENIAAGQRDVISVMASWQASPAHLANITKPTYREVGLSVVLGSDGQLYWCAVFGVVSPASLWDLPIGVYEVGSGPSALWLPDGADDRGKPPW